MSNDLDVHVLEVHLQAIVVASRRAFNDLDVHVLEVQLRARVVAGRRAFGRRHLA